MQDSSLEGVVFTSFKEVSTFTFSLCLDRGQDAAKGTLTTLRREAAWSNIPLPRLLVRSVPWGAGQTGQRI